MKIYEEYLKRCNIDMPTVKHTKFGCVFLKNDSSYSKGVEWLIFNIVFKEPINHPGVYAIRTLRPIHDGCKNTQRLQLIDEQMIEWDAYEEYLMDWVRKKKKSCIIQGVKEITLTAWEMFVHVYDSFFAKHDLAVKIFPTLDDAAPIKDRYLAYQDISNYLYSRHTEVYGIWKYEMVDYIRNYSHWLAHLVEVHGEELLTSQDS